MVASHRPDSDLNSDSAVTVALDHSSGFVGSGIRNIQELFREWRVQTQAGNVHESKQVSAAMVHHGSTELREVRKPCGARVHGCGHAVIEAELGVYPVQPAFIPMPVQITQPRTQRHAARVSNVGAAAGLESRTRSTP